MKKFNNKKGFTLIELLAVIVILAIVAAVTMTVIVPMLSSKPGEAAVISVKEINRAIVNACTAQGIDYSPYGTLTSATTGFTPLSCETGSCSITGTTIANGRTLLENLKINGEAPAKFTVAVTNCRITSACYSWTSGQFAGLKVTGVNEAVAYETGAC